MKATYLTEYGPPEVLTYGELPDPELGPDEALIGVGAPALNHLDVWRRSGARGGLPLEGPHVLGADVAGTVEATSGETGIAAGTRVLLDPSITDNTCNYCRDGETNLCRDYRMLGAALPGGYAEYVNVPAENAHPIPDSLSFEQAATLPLTVQTAYHMLVTRAGLRPGDRVLVQAAGSGVGSAAIQIAKALGAWVVTTAGSDEKVARGLELGADAGINYTQLPQFSARVRELTDGDGVDIVVDHIGASVYEECVNSLRRGGSYVNCGVTAGSEVTFDIARLFRNHLSYHGSFMGTKRELREWMRLVHDGKLGGGGGGGGGEVFPLRDAAEAHRRMESRDFFGKLVLVPEAREPTERRHRP